MLIGLIDQADVYKRFLCIYTLSLEGGLISSLAKTMMWRYHHVDIVFFFFQTSRFGPVYMVE